MSNVSNIKENIDNGEIDKLISEDEGTMISANFYEALTGMNISDQDTAVEFIAQWSPVVKTNRCNQDRIILTHDYYQPITLAIEKLRETINTHTKIVGRVKRLESIPDLLQLSFIPRNICKIKTLRKIQFIQIVVNIIMPQQGLVEQLICFRHRIT